MSTHENVLILRDDAVLAFSAERATTLRVIEAVPAEKCTYTPDAVSKSALELAWHIVAAEHRFAEAVVNGGFDFTNTGRPAELRSPADIARWYSEASQRDMERLARLGPEQLAKPLDFRGRFTLPAVQFLRIGLNHSIHHRGQLSMYLRPMGAKVPAIYGESYDTALAKAAAAQAT